MGKKKRESVTEQVRQFFRLSIVSLNCLILKNHVFFSKEGNAMGNGPLCDPHYLNFSTIIHS